MRPDLISVRRRDVDLEPRLDDHELVVCSAVIPSGAYGQYIYIAIVANGPAPQPSDAQTLRDHFKLTFVDGSRTSTYFLAFSAPLTGNTGIPIYDLIPFTLDKSQGQLERMRKGIAGQSFLQSNLAGPARPGAMQGQLVALFRVPHSAINSLEHFTGWPPSLPQLQSIQIEVSYIQEGPFGPRVSRYSRVGESILSLPKIAQAAPGSAEISLVQDSDRGERVVWEQKRGGDELQSVATATVFEPLGRLFRPLVLHGLHEIANPVIGEAKLPQVGSYRVRMRVNMDRELSELGPIIALFLLTCLLLALAYLVVWFGVLGRVVTLYRRARQWSREGAAKVGALSFTDNEMKIVNSRDELGLLAREFTSLIRSAVSEASDRTRKAWQELQRADARRHVLRAVGHEIRSPLQALMNIIDSSHDGRKYVDRMKAAVDSLLNANSPVDAFEARQAIVQMDDLAVFCKSVAENSLTAGYPNVHYVGPDSGVFVEFDAELLELAVTHILDNANRERAAGTEIRLMLTADDAYAVLAIENSGPQIAEEKMDRIFEYGYTTRTDGLGQGLFVAKVAISKQGAELKAHNLPTGVVFIVTFAVFKE